MGKWSSSITRYPDIRQCTIRIQALDESARFGAFDGGLLGAYGLRGLCSLPDAQSRQKTAMISCVSRAVHDIAVAFSLQYSEYF